MWQAELDGGSHIKPSQQGPLKSASIYISEPANSYTTTRTKDAAFIHLIYNKKTKQNDAIKTATVFSNVGRDREPSQIQSRRCKHH